MLGFSCAASDCSVCSVCSWAKIFLLVMHSWQTRRLCSRLTCALKSFQPVQATSQLGSGQLKRSSSTVSSSASLVSKLMGSFLSVYGTSEGVKSAKGLVEEEVKMRRSILVLQKVHSSFL